MPSNTDDRLNIILREEYLANNIHKLPFANIQKADNIGSDDTSLPGGEARRSQPTVARGGHALRLVRVRGRGYCIEECVQDGEGGRDGRGQVRGAYHSVGLHV